MIFEAFEDYYGKNIAAECFPSLLSEDQQSLPMNIGDLQSAFAKLDKLSNEEKTKQAA